MRARTRVAVVLLSLSPLLCLVCHLEADPPKGSGVVALTGPAPEIPRRAPNIRYDLDLSKERYFFFAPAGYTGKEPYGLVVFTTPGQEITELPVGWKAVLERRKLLFVAAQSAGNDRDNASRCGLAVMGAMLIKQKYNVDPARVYAAGFSGGARMSGLLGFYQPEIFHGTIQSCGADFYEEVPQTHAVPKTTADLGAYGLLRATKDEIDAAKSKVRFVFITGSRDFRYANIQNIYEGGFAKAGFKAKLIDVQGMGHDNANAKALTQALDFIEGTHTSTAPVVAPVAPAWMAQPTNRWPMMLMELDIVFKDKKRLQGASGFLMQLPNGAVVAATAKHPACETGSVDDSLQSFKSFRMHPRTSASRSVTLTKAAISSEDAERLDCLLMRAGSPPWPVQVRPARSTPAEEGETVYLLAVPYTEKSGQNVYKGKVVRSISDDDFAYEFEGKVESRGFSGAPILDASGSVVGMHLGTIGFGDGKEYKHAMNISSAVEACTAPAAAQPARSATSKPAASPMPVHGAAADAPKGT